jgi:succinoglycan biosynthesis transport protein ExoP
MLQANKLPLVQPDPATSADSGGDFYVWFVAFVRRRLPVIVATTLSTIVLAVIYVLNTPPSYTAKATMIIDSAKVNVFQKESIIGELPVDSSMIESQIEILRSENIALAVIKQLRLTDDPEFVGPGGGFIGNAYAAVTSLFGGGEPASEFDLQRRATDAFAKRLFVKRVGLSYVIEISFRAYSPNRAAQIANAVADAYITDQLSAKFQATQRAGQWLEDRIRELREQATAAQRAVVDFKAKNNIVDVDTGGRLMTDQQLSEMNSQYILAQKKTAEMKARLDRILQIINSGGQPDGTVTETLNNQVITKLREQYLELKAREADWSIRYGTNHMAVVNLRNQMDQLRQSILDELKRIAETYKSDYDIARQGEVAMKEGLSQAVTQSQTTDKAQVQLRDLVSSAQTARTLYDNFLQRYMETTQQQSFPITEARVITLATPPSAPSDPKVKVILALSAILGLALGLGIGRLSDLSDRVFRTREQVEAVLKTNCIAVMPVLGNGNAAAASSKRLEIARAPSRRINRGAEVFWEILDHPFSRPAEAIRSIKVAADLYGAKKGCKVLGITSTLPNEGKSTIAAALAALMAQGGAKVLLVDADLRNPSLSRRLAPTAEVGLVEVLSGRAPVSSVACVDSATNLAFVPTVSKSRLLHTSELLGSDATRNFIEQLRAVYDYVIVDLSPLTPVVDVRTVTDLVDAFIFVVEWGATKIGTVEHALAESHGVYENLLGVVLNKADINMLSRYEGYHGHQYYNQYYSRYGYTD